MFLVIKMTLIDRVRQLLEAENEADRKKAEAILASDFVAITRRNGDEQGRSQLLDQIANPPSPNPLREIDDFEVWESGGVGVVRSRVRTSDRTTLALLGHFRNLHVFTKAAGGWWCVDWQVTELKDHVQKTDPGVTKIYEDGKHRRYALLFAVNGGAFAVAKLLVDPDKIPAVAGNLRLEHLAVGMAAFTAVMGVDIDAFGRRMRKREADLYGRVGVSVLVSIGSLLIAGWMMVGFGTLRAMLAVGAYVAILLIVELRAD